jgi:hypothetical protein
VTRGFNYAKLHDITKVVTRNLNKASCCPAACGGDRNGGPLAGAGAEESGPSALHATALSLAAPTAIAAGHRR